MFRRFFTKTAAPLTGAPAIRRLKAYSAASGYVYQYYYQGQRAFRFREESGTEYVFSVSAGRKQWRPVGVFVSGAALLAWEQRHARDLAPTERYAIAKLALFQAFDERPKPEDMLREVRVRAEDAAAILERLQID